MPKFAANLTWMFNEYEFPDRFSAAASMGFRAVECQFPYGWKATDLASACADAGLQMIMFNTPGGNLEAGEYGLAALPGREVEFEESIMHALAYADAFNCKMIHVLAGIVMNDDGQSRYVDTYRKNIAWAARTCEQYGVAILLEPINTIERPGYLISTSREARETIDLLPCRNVAIQFDFHNAQLMEGNLTNALIANIEHIRHMQIAGVPGRTPPDRGEINYTYVFELVDQLEYHGWIGCEFRPGEPTESGLTWARSFGLGQPEV